MIDHANRVFLFGDFELDAARRLLKRDGQTVPLKAKTFDLLLTLVESGGEILTKNDLLDRVWENQFVEENNLTVHIAALRKALGESKNENRYIITIPGRGYRFVANVAYQVDEVVVESRSLSRIVVEEEIQESDERVPSIAGLSSYITDKYRLAGVFTGVLMLLIGGAGWFYGSRNANNHIEVRKTVPQFTARVVSSAGGGVPERVTISPDGRTIAFVERRKGQYAVRLGEIEASNSVEIVPFHYRLYRHLAFAPDGKTLYFTAKDANHMEPALMRVSILGGAVQDLIAGVDSTFTFSPDGKLVAFFRKGANDSTSSIVVADTGTGKSERSITVPEFPDDTLGAGLSWSPDGKLIAFATAGRDGNRLMAVDVTDKTVSAIGDAVPNRIVNFVWLHDGSGLIVNRNTEPQPNDGHIWLVSYPSGESVALTDEALTYSFASLSTSSDKKIAIIQTRSDPRIAISQDTDPLSAGLILTGSRARGEGMNGITPAPDGKLLFTAVVNESRTIWEMDADGSNQRQLTPFEPGPGDGQIDVTPDNRYIVFQSERTGSLEIWRANRDGSDAKPLTTGGNNAHPSLSPDGSWIIYSALREGNVGLRRISIHGGDPAIVTTEKCFWPDVSPDGKFIAYAHGGSERAPSRDIRVIPIDGGRAVRSYQVPLTGVLYNRLRWSPNGDSIFYKDHTQGLWRQDISSDNPVEISSGDDLRIFHFAFSADGSIVYSAGTQMREIVILESANL